MSQRLLQSVTTLHDANGLSTDLPLTGSKEHSGRPGPLLDQKLGNV